MNKHIHSRECSPLPSYTFWNGNYLENESINSDEILVEMNLIDQEQDEMISKLMRTDTRSEEWGIVDELHDETLRKDQDSRAGEHVQYCYYLLPDNDILCHSEAIVSDPDEKDIVAETEGGD